ncbi:Hsp70 family protein [Williamsia herbipolensis]|uniref:Hsp70 family protein n=1 Tax=Williamsia herbipolensis TaxID=1603258 RepID=UPI0013649371|nr:Hsp70 family protein [Williamsia herbipolensis]
MAGGHHNSTAGGHHTPAAAADTRRPSGLGMKIGASMSVAVSSTPSGTYDALVRPTALEVAPGREPVLASARQDAGAEGSARLSGFTERVGDPVELVADDGRRFSGEDLYATALACLAAESRSDATSVVVTCPNGWQPYTVDMVRAAADAHGLSDVTFVPEAIASVTAAQATGRELPSDVVVVFDLGGSALDITVVRTGDESQILGRPTRSEEISGDSFDQLLLAHVLQSVDAADSIDPFEPATVEALTALRRRCTIAKETLSVDTDTTLTVDLPGLHTETRLVRSEIESLLHDQMFAAVSLLRDAVTASGHSLRDVGALLLTGGGAAMPLVTEMLSGVLRIPVVVDADPATTSAFGAAILAAEIDAAPGALDAMPANAAAAAAEVAGATSNASASASAETVVSRTVSPAPRTPVAATSTSGRTRRLAIIGGVAVAIALITAGGLSVGTALSSSESPAATTATSAATPAASSPAAPSAAARSGAPASAARTSAANDARSSGSSDRTSGGSTSGGTGSGSTGSGSGGTQSGGASNGGSTSGGTSNGSGGGTSGGSTGGGATSGGSTGGSGSTGGGSGSGDTGSGGDTVPEQTFNPIPTVPALPTVPGLGGLFGR